MREPGRVDSCKSAAAADGVRLWTEPCGASPAAGICLCRCGWHHGAPGELRLHEQHGVPRIDVLLIRHGSLDDGDAVLWGRTPGVVLSRRGHREMSRLADALAPAGLRRIVSSPQLRTLESAGVLARGLGASIDVDADADEFDVGQWTGGRFDGRGVG